MAKIQQISFENENRPSSNFDLLRLEDLFTRTLDHDITIPHRINFFHILFITEGEGKHGIDFEDYSYERGTLLTIRKNQVHQFYKAEGVKGLMFLFTEDFLAKYYSPEEGLKTFHLFNEFLSSPKLTLSDESFNEVMTIAHIIETEYYERGDDFALRIIRSALDILTVKLLRLKQDNELLLFPKKHIVSFLRFQKLVDENCFRTKKVLDYAKMMHCSNKTLNTICRSITGKPAKAVLDEVLILKIKRLLINNSSSSVTEIAFLSGFAEPTNFYKYFKKLVGCSPNEFRKQHQ